MDVDINSTVVTLLTNSHLVLATLFRKRRRPPELVSVHGAPEHFSGLPGSMVRCAHVDYRMRS